MTQIENEIVSAWERVVADEGDGADVRAVVAECELDPERYRSLALEILEHRQLQQQLRSALSVTKPTEIQSPQTSHAVTLLTWFPWSLAGALAMVVGSLLLQQPTPTNVSDLAPVVNQNESTQPVMRASDHTGSDQTGPDQTWTDQRDGHKSSLDPTLLVKQSRLPDSLNWIDSIARPILADETKQAIRRAGLNIQERTNIYLIEDESGTQYAIPDRDLELRFITHSADDR